VRGCIRARIEGQLVHLVSVAAKKGAIRAG